MFICSIKQESIRESILNIFKIFKGKIIILFIVEIIYLTFIIIILNKVNLWKISYSKDVILWFLFTGIVAIFKYNSEKTWFKFILFYLKQTITLSIISDFFINLKTFSLGIELMLIPVATIVYSMKMLVDKNDEYIILRKPLFFLGSLIGLVVIFKGLKNLYLNYSQLGNIDVIKNMALLPILSILFIPMIYLIILMIEYEDIFIRLKIGQSKSKKVVIYAKYCIVIECKGNLSKLKEVKNIGLYNLMSIKTTEDVKQMRKIYKQKFKKQKGETNYEEVIFSNRK